MLGKGLHFGAPPSSGGRNGCGVVQGLVQGGGRGWCKAGVQNCQVGCSGRHGSAGSGQGQHDEGAG